MKRVQTSAPKKNPGLGRRVIFHGAFRSAAEADRKRIAIGGYVQKRIIRGQPRYLVMTTKARMIQRERYLRRPAMNPKARPRRNPASVNHGIVGQIGGKVRAVVYQKGPGHRCDAACARSGHNYIHRFRERVGMYKLRDGAVLLRWDGR
jgi:hypothetical protein